VPVIDPYEEADLRRRQAEQARVERKVDLRNSWLAIPVLAPAIVAGALELGGAAGAETLRATFRRSPLSFAELDPWQVRPLDTVAKTALRKEAREIWARAYGTKAGDMGAHVHHSPSLEYAHLLPKANPNRLAALNAYRPPAHQIGTNAWAAFGRSLQGRIPTQAEIMAAKLEIERIMEPYLLRRGVPRLPIKHSGLK
jgi:hypothetical protein